jgi:uncharacterized peroxidase-related enzyme
VAYLPEGHVPEGFAPFLAFRQGLGFLPAIFRAQTLLPRVLEAEAAIAGSVLIKEEALTRQQKESILLALAASKGNLYCATAHSYVLRSLGRSEKEVDALLAAPGAAGLAPEDEALVDFAMKLGREPTALGAEDVEKLRRHGFSDVAVLETVLTTALTSFLCTPVGGPGRRPRLRPGGPAPPGRQRRGRGRRAGEVGADLPAGKPPLRALPAGAAPRARVLRPLRLLPGALRLRPQHLPRPDPAS